MLFIFAPGSPTAQRQSPPSYSLSSSTGIMGLTGIGPLSKADEGDPLLPKTGPRSGSEPSPPPYAHPSPPAPRHVPTFSFRGHLHSYILFMICILSSIYLSQYIYPLIVPSRPESLSKWLQKEEVLALQRVLLNIGPVVGAGDGLVIASPSIGNGDEPNYYYTWTRDSALTMSSLLPYLFTTNQSGPPSGLSVQGVLMEPLFRHYIESQAKLQVGVNPSGGLTTGGLNEPKFYVDGTAFTGSWGRPQRDGPALRALTIMRYAEFILDRGFPGDLKYVEEYLYSPKKIRTPGKVVKNDLEEVAHGWWKGGFDIWEEIDGHHLFTLLASRKALQSGASLASRLNDPYAARFYTEQAQLITASLPNFWDERKSYWLSSLSYKDFQVPHGNLTASYAKPEKRKEDDEVDEEYLPGLPERQWLDCSLPLSLIHTTEYGLNTTFAGASMGLSPASDKVLASLRAYILSFEGLYGVNLDGKMGKDRPWVQGWALGRYREDVYTGNGKGLANPWYICTYSLAHSLYLARNAFVKQGFIDITPLSQPFWSDITSSHNWLSSLSPKPHAGETWTRGCKEFDHALEQLGQVGDRFVRVGALNACPQKGRMSEQFGRDDGLPKGARDLTWSYASLLDMWHARGKASWTPCDWRDC